MTRLTMEQAVIVSAYTGFLVCPFHEMHKAIEEKLGRPVWTHELGTGETMEKVKEAFKDDFIALTPVDV